ncbi:hypothetical protein [Mucilaginibacter aquariorum]|uniref:DUF4625 domain-containing protein n=1 Tax=Mucilaginibacter aquariorum TaxID=2967225 RepID=A0ABT1SYZ4_9SPHI|nr:hypothetical protein [Mucilaginibacter aquariorum]MCQ6957433.1 hypothetical protein [Mucilaginibacter aquariorum]
MKKYINIVLAALVTLTMFSCTKEADVAGIEPKLPAIQLSSLGYQQVGPFVISGNTANTLLLNFGATLTNQEPGAFKLEILDGTTAASPVLTTVNFATWNGNDATSTPAIPATETTPAKPAVVVHTITATPQETTYPNTTVMAGTILLKLNSLGLAAGKTYSVRATAYNKDGSKNSVFTALSFFKTAAL